MAYTKTKWVNNSKPAINQDNLNHAEQGIADAHDLIAAETNNRQKDTNTVKDMINAETLARQKATAVRQVIGDDGYLYNEYYTVA